MQDQLDIVEWRREEIEGVFNDMLKGGWVGRDKVGNQREKTGMGVVFDSLVVKEMFAIDQEGQM